MFVEHHKFWLSFGWFSLGRYSWWMLIFQHIAIHGNLLFLEDVLWWTPFVWWTHFDRWTFSALCIWKWFQCHWPIWQMISTIGESTSRFAVAGVATSATISGIGVGTGIARVSLWISFWDSLWISVWARRGTMVDGSIWLYDCGSMVECYQERLDVAPATEYPSEDRCGVGGWFVFCLVCDTLVGEAHVHSKQHVRKIANVAWYKTCYSRPSGSGLPPPPPSQQ